MKLLLLFFAGLLICSFVKGQTLFFPKGALVKDSLGETVSTRVNSLHSKKINDTLQYATVTIALDKNMPVSDIDIAIPIVFQNTQDLEASKQQFHWLPGINSKPGQIIPQHLFRSPAMIFTFTDRAVVLIPDIKKLPADHPAPHYMQVEYNANFIVLHYGLSNYKVIPHQYYEKSGKPFTLPKKLEIGFYVLTPTVAEPLTVLRMTNNFLWERFAKTYTKSVLPQTVAFDTYAKVGYSMALDHLWVDAGKGKGGITLSTFYDDSTKLYRGRYFKDDLWFQSWFNNMRTAYGLYSWGKSLNRPEWIAKAKEIANLLVSAPVDKGWFPTIYDSGKDIWIASSQQRGRVYHTADNAWAAYWLLRFNEELFAVEGADTLLLDFSNALLRSQNEDGSFPTMVDATTLAPDSVLNHTASSAMATWYLEELLLRNKIPQDSLDAMKCAVLRSLDFLSREILPLQKFEDFELYFSCSPKPMHYYDSTTNLYAQNTLAIQWCAEAYLKGFELFKDRRYLDKGEYCLNILSLYQQVWNPPFISFYAFGGFGVQNTDAEWNDARQAQFAETYLQYYKVTGNIEYRERAIAACRASFALMVLPENKNVAPNNYMGTPRNGESQPGTMAENYGHSGYDERSYQSGFHWGTGSALTTAAIFACEFGDLLNSSRSNRKSNKK